MIDQNNPSRPQMQESQRQVEIKTSRERRRKSHKNQRNIIKIDGHDDDVMMTIT
jgi:hypothetical protein